MRELKASTKAGQRVLSMYDSVAGYTLSDVYGRYSDDKARAFRYCWNMYLKCQNHTGFHICSANTFGFTVGWMCEKADGEPVVIVRTKDNDYMVYLNK